MEIHWISAQKPWRHEASFPPTSRSQKDGGNDFFFGGERCIWRAQMSGGWRWLLLFYVFWCNLNLLRYLRWYKTSTPSRHRRKLVDILRCTLDGISFVAKKKHWLIDATWNMRSAEKLQKLWCDVVWEGYLCKLGWNHQSPIATHTTNAYGFSFASTGKWLFKSVFPTKPWLPLMYFREGTQSKSKTIVKRTAPLFKVPGILCSNLSI